MTYAVSRLIFKSNETIISKKSYVSIGIDVALIFGSPLIGGLILGRIINIHLPVGVGTTSGFWLAAALCAASTAIILMDVVSYKLKSTKNKDLEFLLESESYDRETLIEKYREIIVHAPYVGPMSSSLPQFIRTRILRNVYIGNVNSFFDAVQVSSELAIGKPDEKIEFGVVISMCPLQEIAHRNFRKEMSEEEIKEVINTSCESRNAKWLMLGEGVGDAENYWKQLVLNCTNLEELPEDVAEWFEPTFKEIDKGVFGDQNVLIHCQMGVSRSSTLLMAYLINRFHVSASEAGQFLRFKRQCTRSNFMNKLALYEQKLGTGPSSF